ncbi:MAG: alpha/beta fold hydrolase, partial [Humibacter sp.]
EARFRLRPPQDAPECVMAVLRDVAIRETSEGWTWRNDIGARGDYLDPRLGGLIGRITVPSMWVFAEASISLQLEAAPHIVQDAVAEYRLVSIPKTHHHLLLEEPAVVAELIEQFSDEVQRTG